MDYSENVKKKFTELFDKEPILIKSPGRVNLIGEHTDYNMGFVMPAAIDKAIYFAISPREDDLCMLHALDMRASYDFALDDIRKSDLGWPNYLLGVVDQLQKAGHQLRGFNCVYGGDIPIGAGLSSSAAVEAGLAFGLNELCKLGIGRLSLVKLAQMAENKFVGVNCGIMDQYINIFGKPGNVVRIDCRSLDYELLPFAYEDISIVLFNTNVSHSLASSEYNQRRKECTAGVELLKTIYPGIQSLRDVSSEQLHAVKEKLDPVVYRRCHYVVSENERLMKAGDILRAHDLKTFGQMMYETHEGLSKDYEVSCPELDYLVELTKEYTEVFGSRMMGGGFGGCTINLIATEKIEAIRQQVTEKYQQKFGRRADCYITKISDGTHLI